MSRADVRKKLAKAKHQLTPREQKYQQLKEKVQGKPEDVKKFKSRMTRLRSMKRKWAPFQEAIDKYVARKEKESTNLPEKIRKLEEVVQKECPHPIDMLEVEESYNSGSYYDTASTNYYVRCKACGHYEQVDSKDHGWYG